MKIKIRYEDHFQTVEVTEAECESMIRNDYEERLAAAVDPATVQPRTMQEILDERFNKPEYNNYHMYYRKTYPLDDCDFEGETFMDESKSPSNLFEAEEHFLETEELKRAVSELLCKLPPEQQDLIRRVFFEGESLSDIAREHGVHRSTICRRIEKIVAILRNNLKIS